MAFAGGKPEPEGGPGEVRAAEAAGASAFEPLPRGAGLLAAGRIAAGRAIEFVFLRVLADFAEDFGDFFLGGLAVG